jgi:lipopolysaccharide/colanic/teichoic acid biosynthesis glycosyltransferase
MELTRVRIPDALDARAASYAASTRGLKRLFDVTLTLLVLPFALVAMGLAALAILLETGAPVLFVQTRIGRDGKPFRLYKFRTLAPRFDTTTATRAMQAFVRGEGQLEAQGSARRGLKPFRRSDLSPAARFLRETGLDELPQLWNILRGEMSWVGPRPNVPAEVDVYAEWHRERFALLPGITGLAQVRGAHLLTFDEMVQSDLEYRACASLRLDLKILLWTMLWVGWGRAAPQRSPRRDR